MCVCVCLVERDALRKDTVMDKVDVNLSFPELFKRKPYFKCKLVVQIVGTTSRNVHALYSI